MIKSVVIYSGGMDSFTLLHAARKLEHEVSALSFLYGQRHAKELDKAAEVCRKLKVPHRIVNLEPALCGLLSGSALLSDRPVPEGHYANSNMKATVVPNRNMIMLSIAIGYAVSLEYGNVLIGAHAGDHEIYPDCRPEFIQGVHDLALIANYRPVQVLAPFIHMTKAQILQEGRRIGLSAMHYLDTWTCYKGERLACGRCGSCVERLEAFDIAGWEDPQVYADRSYYRSALEHRS